MASVLQKGNEGVSACIGWCPDMVNPSIEMLEKNRPTPGNAGFPASFGIIRRK